MYSRLIVAVFLPILAQSVDGIIEPHFSSNDYVAKQSVVENCVFATLGRGNWYSCVEGVIEGIEWVLSCGQVSVMVVNSGELRSKSAT